MTSFYENSGVVYLLLKFIPKYNTLVLVWSSNTYTADIAKACCRHALTLTEEVKAKFIINDNRRHTGAWVDIGTWLLDTWIPDLAKSGVTHFCHILSPRLFGQLSAKSIFNQVRNGIEFQTFHNSSSAIKWLRKQEFLRLQEDKKPDLFTELSVDKALLQELQEYNETLKIASESARIAIWTENLYTGESWYNQEMINLYELDPRENQYDEYVWLSRVSESEKAGIEEAKQKAIATKKVQKDIYLKAYLPSGSIRFTRLTIAPIMDLRGERVLKLIGVNNDVTEYQEKEIELEKALVKKNQLLRELHHRIKNNLTMVAGFLFLKSENEDSTAVSSFADDIRSKINSIAVIYDHLLRTEEESVVSTRSYLLELVQLIGDAVGKNESIQIICDVENHRLHIDTLTTVGLLVNELVTNALKHAFTASKVGKVNVSFSKADGKYTLIVEDSGSGFDLESHKDGMGLVFIDVFVKQLNGEMQANTTTGSRFEIAFAS
jgi:two-component sensor histidine kinase